MARFFVGQRVRCVAPWRRSLNFIEMIDWARLKGVEAVVNEIDCKSILGEDGVGITAFGNTDWLMPPYGLEPILPSGHQPAELTVEELLPFLKAREVSDVAV